MDMMFLGIVAFLIVLAVFDLVVGVSNDAVNFLNSAIGAKVAKFRTIVTIAAIGVFAGAAMSNGMMDVARHGIMTPEYFSFYDVMCVYLAVMVTDVVLLDVFNTHGMPTSTTVSMVFELLGGAFAIAILQIAKGAATADGTLLTLGDLLNTEKAITCIMGIFLSVAIAFVVGCVVMWVTRLLLTFTYNKYIRWISKVVVLFGTSLLAFSFASNDLVNFVGVPLTGLEAYQDFMANGDGNAQTFMMQSLMESAHTPVLYLILAGVAMVLSLVFSKKAQNVVKTSVDLSRQDEGDEMFGSSGVARTLVRTSSRMANVITAIIPDSVAHWIDSRFNADGAVLRKDAAFDEIRAAVNLVLAGALVALGTFLKLPLSTTYVTFMVAMGTSLADRAWSRDSAVFRITGVLSVIGGWFITAGVAFTICYIVTNVMHFGGFIAMAAAICLAVFLLIRSNFGKAKKKEQDKSDEIFATMLRTADKTECWTLLRQHVDATTTDTLLAVRENYSMLTTAFFSEDYRTLRRATSQYEDMHKNIKRQRRKQIVGLRRIDPVLSIERGTWYFLQNSSLSQMVYSLKRMGEPCREHLAGNLRPVDAAYRNEFLAYRDAIVRLFCQPSTSASSHQIREDALKLQTSLSDYRKRIIHDIQTKQLNIESMTVFLNLVQESQELLSGLRHVLRGKTKFEE